MREPRPVPVVHQAVLAFAFEFSFSFLFSFSVVFSFRTLWRWRPLPVFLASSSPHRRRGRDCPRLWLQHCNHAVTNCRVLVERTVEVPIFFVDKLVDFLHQKAVSQHEFFKIWRTKPTVVCVLLSKAGHEFGVKRFVRNHVTSSTKSEGIAADLQNLVDAPRASNCATSSKHI